MTYDAWKLKSDRDDAPDEEEEDRAPSEAEFAIIDFERSWETLVAHHGIDSARSIAYRVMRLTNINSK